MKIKILFLIFTLTSCNLGKGKIEIECGCIESNNRNILVTATVDSDNISLLNNFYSFLIEVERDRDLYGLCISSEGNRQKFIFCTDNSSLMRELDDEYGNEISIREEDMSSR